MPTRFCCGLFYLKAHVLNVYLMNLSHIINRDFWHLNENVQQMQKHYVKTGIFNEDDIENVLKITNGDNFTKIIADLYAWQVGLGFVQGATRKNYGEIEKRLLLDLYNEIKTYNKNFFPIEGFDPFNNKLHPLEIFIAFTIRKNAKELLSKLPSVYLRNLKQDIRKPRDLKEFEYELKNTLSTISHYLKLLDKLSEEKRDKIFKKVFSSNNQTIEQVAKQLKKTDIMYLDHAEGIEELRDKIEFEEDSDEAKKLYDDGQIIVVDVKSSDAMKNLGCGSQWCFVTEHGIDQWLNYADNSHVNIVYNFNRDSDSRTRMVVVLPQGDVYDMYNDLMDDEHPDGEGWYYLDSIGAADHVNANLVKEEIEEDVEFDTETNTFNPKELTNLRSFAARKRYADKFLPKIGQGSSRITYEYGPDKVLKLAKNPKGIAQNDEEISKGRHDWYAKDYVTEVFDADEEGNTWLIAERSRKLTPNRFKQLTGVGIDELKNWLLHLDSTNNPKRYMGYKYHGLSKERDEELWNNEFSSGIVDFMLNYDMAAGDFGRISSYGEVIRDGQPDVVLVDYGFTHDVSDDYYTKKRFGEAEDKSVEGLAKTMNADIIYDKNNDPYFVRELGGHNDYFGVFAYDRGRFNQIGGVNYHIKDGKVIPLGVSINDKYQKRGIGTALYKHIKEKLGMNLQPSHNQTKAGKKLWQSVGKLDEDYKKDRKKIGIAKKVYQLVKDNIKNVDFDFIEVKGIKQTLYLIGFNLNQISDFDLKILFLPASDINAMFSRTNNALIFHILDGAFPMRELSNPDRGDKYREEEFAKLRFNSWVEERVFVHEFVHYLDSLDYGETYKSYSQKSKGEAISMKDYYNTPEEYNAFYTEGINNIIKNIKKYYVGDFKSFIKKVYQLSQTNNEPFRRRFLSSLNERNRRGLIKRLYDFYNSRISNKVNEADYFSRFIDPEDLDDANPQLGNVRDGGYGGWALQPYSVSDGYTAINESFGFNDLSYEEQENMYNVFRDSYIKATGSAWDRNKFERRAQNWEFYGTNTGFVAVRPQRGGLYKLVGVGGEKISIMKGMHELLSRGVPIWGVVTDKIAGILKSKFSFKTPSKIMTKILLKMIPSSAYGNVPLIVNNDGSITLEYSDVGATKKFFIGNDAYFKKLREKLISKGSDIVKDKLKKLNPFAKTESVINEEIDNELTFFDPHELGEGLKDELVTRHNINQPVGKIFITGGEINEDSFTEEDIPKKFNVAVSINQYDESKFRTFFKNLKNQKLEGVKGISDSPKNVANWFPNRNALIIMDADKTLKINNLSKVNYDNPHYLVQDNFKPYKRLAADNPKSNNNHVLELIVGYIKLYAIKNNLIKHGDEEFREHLWRNDNIIHKIPYKLQDVYIKNFWDFVKKVNELFDNKLNEKTLQKVLWTVLKKAGNIFSGEGEWIVKDNVLNIPKGSTIVLKNREIGFYDKMGKKFYTEFDSWKELYEKYIDEYQLDDLYNFKFADAEKINKYQYKMLDRTEKKGKEKYDKYIKEIPQKIAEKSKQAFSNQLKKHIKERDEYYKEQNSGYQYGGYYKDGSPYDTEEVQSIFFIDILNDFLEFHYENTLKTSPIEYDFKNMFWADNLITKFNQNKDEYYQKLEKFDSHEIDEEDILYIVRMALRDFEEEFPKIMSSMKDEYEQYIHNIKTYNVDEDLNYNHVTDASPESDQYEIVSESDHYDKPMYDAIANHVKDQLEFQSVNFFDCGSFGCVYDVNSGQFLMKVTPDKQEAINSQKIMRNPDPNFAQIYGVYKIKYRGKKQYHRTGEKYIILQERIPEQIDVSVILSLADKIEEYLETSIQQFFIDYKNNFKYIEDVYGDYIYKEFQEKLTPQEKRLFNGMMKIATKTRELGLSTVDFINAGNLGWKNNELMFFDLGGGNWRKGKFEKNPPKLKRLVGEDGTSLYTTVSGTRNADDIAPWLQEEVYPFSYEDDYLEDELGLDNDDIMNQADDVANKSGIRISNNKELSGVAIEDSKVIGAVYSSLLGDEYSFDVVVSEPYRGKGVGKELVEFAMDEYNSYKNIYDQNIKLNIDVVNPVMRTLLKKHHGLKDVQQTGPDRFTMTEEESIVQYDQLDDVVKALSDECFAIISAFVKNKSNDYNSNATDLLYEKVLKPLDGEIIKMTGQWDENVLETSFLVRKPDDMECNDFMGIIERAARIFKQESYLWNDRGDIIINYTDGSDDDIGDDLNVRNSYVGFKFETFEYDLNEDDEFLITEKRRSAKEKNIKTTPQEKVRKRFEEVENSGEKEKYFYSFRSDYHTTMINPKNDFDTPTGIYSYPFLDYLEKKNIEDKTDIIKLVPFTGDDPAKYIYEYKLKSFDGIITSKDSLQEVEKYFIGLKEYISKYPDGQLDKLKQVINSFIDSKYNLEILKNEYPHWKFRKSPASWLWSLLFKAFPDVNEFRNNSVILGINGFVDFGDGFIHSNEPYQAVFFKGRSIMESIDIIPLTKKEEIEKDVSKISLEDGKLFKLPKKQRIYLIKKFGQKVGNLYFIGNFSYDIRGVLNGNLKEVFFNELDGAQQAKILNSRVKKRKFLEVLRTFSDGKIFLVEDTKNDYKFVDQNGNETLEGISLDDINDVMFDNVRAEYYNQKLGAGVKFYNVGKFELAGGKIATTIYSDEKDKKQKIGFINIDGKFTTEGIDDDDFFLMNDVYRATYMNIKHNTNFALFSKFKYANNTIGVGMKKDDGDDYSFYNKNGEKTIEGITRQDIDKMSALDRAIYINQKLGEKRYGLVDKFNYANFKIAKAKEIEDKGKDPTYHVFINEEGNKSIDGITMEDLNQFMDDNERAAYINQRIDNKGFYVSISEFKFADGKLAYAFSFKKPNYSFIDINGNLTIDGINKDDVREMDEDQVTAFYRLYKKLSDGNQIKKMFGFHFGNGEISLAEYETGEHLFVNREGEPTIEGITVDDILEMNPTQKAYYYNQKEGKNIYHHVTDFIFGDFSIALANLGYKKYKFININGDESTKDVAIKQLNSEQLSDDTRAQFFNQRLGEEKFESVGSFYNANSVFAYAMARLIDGRQVIINKDGEESVSEFEESDEGKPKNLRLNAAYINTKYGKNFELVDEFSFGNNDIARGAKKGDDVIFINKEGEPSVEGITPEQLNDLSSDDRKRYLQQKTGIKYSGVDEFKYANNTIAMALLDHNYVFINFDGVPTIEGITYFDIKNFNEIGRRTYFNQKAGEKIYDSIDSFNYNDGNIALANKIDNTKVFIDLDGEETIEGFTEGDVTNLTTVGRAAYYNIKLNTNKFSTISSFAYGDEGNLLAMASMKEDKQVKSVFINKEGKKSVNGIDINKPQIANSIIAIYLNTINENLNITDIIGNGFQFGNNNVATVKNFDGGFDFINKKGENAVDEITSDDLKSFSSTLKLIYFNKKWDKKYKQIYRTYDNAFLVFDERGRPIFIDSVDGRPTKDIPEKVSDTNLNDSDMVNAAVLNSLYDRNFTDVAKLSINDTYLATTINKTTIFVDKTGKPSVENIDFEMVKDKFDSAFRAYYFNTLLKKNAYKKVYIEDNGLIIAQIMGTDNHIFIGMNGKPSINKINYEELTTDTERKIYEKTKQILQGGKTNKEESVLFFRIFFFQYRLLILHSLFY
jgi:GNAT superfamily N-acetyltransferase